MRPKERRGPPRIVVGGIRTIPDQGLRGDVEVVGPGHGPVTGSDARERGIFGTEPLEHRSPEQVLHVPLDHGSVGQREPEVPFAKWRGGSNSQHDRPILPRRRDRHEGEDNLGIHHLAILALLPERMDRRDCPAPHVVELLSALREPDLEHRG